MMYCMFAFRECRNGLQVRLIDLRVTAAFSFVLVIVSGRHFVQPKPFPPRQRNLFISFFHSFKAHNISTSPCPAAVVCQGEYKPDVVISTIYLPVQCCLHRMKPVVFLKSLINRICSGITSRRGEICPLHSTVLAALSLIHQCVAHANNSDVK